MTNKRNDQALVNPQNRIQDPLADKVFYVIVYIFLAFLTLSTLYPLVYVASSSFSSARAVTLGKVVLWPVEPSIMGYAKIFEYKSVLTGYKNTIIYTVCGTALTVFMTLIAGYGLSRSEIKGHGFLTFLFAFTMWFSGGMIPTYLLIRSLGMINTRWAMIIPGLVSAWNVIITRTFFQSSIPNDLFESASLDGCDHFGYFTRIVLPLSGAIVAVVSLFAAVTHWNAYFNAFLYLNDSKLFPLQLILKDILIANKLDNELTTVEVSGSAKVEYGMDDLLKYSLIMVSCVPVWCMYPFVQKFFVKGVMVGSIKG